MHVTALVARTRSTRSVAGAVGWSAVLLLGPVTGAPAGDFFTQRGTDPPFSSVLESGDLPRDRNSRTGVEGSRISVNHRLLRDGPNARRGIEGAINIHTLGSSLIPRRDFHKWSRWYQEDGNTQIFRLFKGEENVRNDREKAARIEAFSEAKWEAGGGWHEWVGTYTLIKPIGAILQVKNSENDWAVQLTANANGDVTLDHRRAEDKVIARGMIGEPFHIRVRDNGHDYEVYLNDVKQGEGSYDRPRGHTRFRWGMYVGAHDVEYDAMLLVTGAAVDP